MEWQPIETAPKDGAVILIIDMSAAAPSADLAHYGQVFPGKFYWRTGDKYEWEMNPKIAREALGVYETPTHWMPLPEPPK